MHTRINKQTIGGGEDKMNQWCRQKICNGRAQNWQAKPGRKFLLINIHEDKESIIFSQIP